MDLNCHELLESVGIRQQTRGERNDHYGKAAPRRSEVPGEEFNFREGRQAPLRPGMKRNVGNDGGLEPLYFRFGPFSAAAATCGKRGIRDTYRRLKRVPEYFRVFCGHFLNTRFVFRISMAAKRGEKDEHERKNRLQLVQKQNNTFPYPEEKSGKSFVHKQSGSCLLPLSLVTKRTQTNM